MKAPQRIYLDHAATTPVADEVLRAMLPYFSDRGFNPSGLYAEARAARHGLDAAREKVAAVFKCEPEEVVFTGSGSEAANLAVKGAAMAQRQHGRNTIAVSAIEHHCVLHAAEFLERFLGFHVVRLPVDRHGVVDLAALAGVIDANLAVVSVQYANNEVGTIQPLREIRGMLRGSGAIFHTDAVQAAGALALDVDELGVDLLSIAAHKFYGPKGIGALYVRADTRLVPQIQGGSQERNRRAGTENVALIVGLAEALAIAQASREKENARIFGISQRLRRGLQDIPGLHFNGHPTNRLPNNTNVCVEGVNGEGLLLELDRAGVAASSGSACTSASLEPSHVLLAMGISPDIARGSLRLTTGRSNDERQIDDFLNILAPIVEKLRRVPAAAG